MFLDFGFFLSLAAFLAVLGIVLWLTVKLTRRH